MIYIVIIFLKVLTLDRVGGKSEGADLHDLASDSTQLLNMANFQQNLSIIKNWEPQTTQEIHNFTEKLKKYFTFS